MFGVLKKLFGVEHASAGSVENRDATREWYSWKPKDGPPTPPNGFVKLPKATEVSVAGTSYRIEDCKLFLSALKGGRAGANSIDLRRDSSNPEHPHAIAVFGLLGHKEVHIGYIPSDLSDMIRTKFSSDMPLKAGLKEWGKKKSAEAVFFRITVFVPGAKERKQFELNQSRRLAE